MPQENVELVRRVYELWGRQEWSAIPDYFHPDVRLDLSRNVFNPDVYSGYDGLDRALRGIDEIWERFNIVPTEILDAGDKVLATVTISGTGRESGADVNMTVMNLWTIRDGKIADVVGGYRDRAEALEAAGLA